MLVYLVHVFNGNTFTVVENITRTSTRCQVMESCSRRDKLNIAWIDPGLRVILRALELSKESFVNQR